PAPIAASPSWNPSGPDCRVTTDVVAGLMVCMSRRPNRPKGALMMVAARWAATDSGFGVPPDPTPGPIGTAPAIPGAEAAVAAEIAARVTMRLMRGMSGLLEVV